MISPGALVVCKQTGATLYCVKAPASGGRWYLAGKRIDASGRSDVFGRVAGAGDITVIREAKTFEPGEVIEYEGLYHEVARDLGDEVELICPAGRNPLKGGGGVHMHAGQNKKINKGDLILEVMK